MIKKSQGQECILRPLTLVQPLPNSPLVQKEKIESERDHLGLAAIVRINHQLNADLQRLSLVKVTDLGSRILTVQGLELIKETRPIIHLLIQLARRERKNRTFCLQGQEHTKKKAVLQRTEWEIPNLEIHRGQTLLEMIKHLNQAQVHTIAQLINHLAKEE